MNSKKQPLKSGISALLAAVMAAAATQAALTAMGFSCGWAAFYLPALLAAGLCFAASLSRAAAIASLAAGVLAAAGVVAARMSGFSALRTMVSALGSQTPVDPAVQAAAGGLLAILIAAATAAVGYALTEHGGTPVALLAFFGTVMISYALAEEMPFGPIVPGLIAALTAMALSAETQPDRTAWRALIPAGLAVALALMLTPTDRLTWEPLEQAAQRIRATVEDYFRFTQERIPFTINTEGYNHGAEENGYVVSHLGGPATPDPEAVMTVTADRDVLLSGTIRRVYTGNAWLDTETKARYLYVDFTRLPVRNRVFGTNGNDIFTPVNVTVEFLSDGTSTLFVPGRMDDFSMDQETAVYYNSIGEIFISRTVAAGDTYSLTGYMPEDRAALEQRVIALQGENDSAYDEILRSCTQLPEGIEDGVYALAMELTAGQTNAYAKAAAIESWLKNNCDYTLTPGYPDDNRDFVSQFLLEEREGYCSHFASAMTVLCRIAGLPARYVEGYSVPGGSGEAVTVTGENAHARQEAGFGLRNILEFAQTLRQADCTEAQTLAAGQ